MHPRPYSLIAFLGSIPPLLEPTVRTSANQAVRCRRAARDAGNLTRLEWTMVKITVTGVGDKPIEVNSVDEAFEIIQSEEFYRAIGEFIFRFSQLEYLIKSALASYLELRDDQFDAVVGPY